MNKQQLIDIINRKGPNGGRKEAARTARIAGGALALLAEPILRGSWPGPNGVLLRAVAEAHVSIPAINRIYLSEDPEAAAEFADSDPDFAWVARKIRKGTWDPNGRRREETNGGAVQEEKKSFDATAAQKRAIELCGSQTRGFDHKPGFMRKQTRPDGSDRSASERRKRDRAARDRALRAKMKTGGSGGKKKEKKN